MRTTIFDRIKSIFASNKEAYWWNHLTDEEKHLRRMDVWELAKVIHEARVRNLAGEAEKLIVAEHMLAERLARIQARPAYFAIYAGLAGVAGGAFLTSALQPANEPSKCICETRYVVQEQRTANPPVPPESAVGKPSGADIGAKQTKQPNGNGIAKP